MLTLSAVASAALAAPSSSSSSSRLRRDVSELVDASAVDFVPPVTEYLPAIEDGSGATELPSAALGEQGYEYRTVRRLKLRHRRDVSHLPANQYLPPQPSNRYLPPAPVPTPAAAPAPVQADDTEEVVSAVEPKVAREYLPPVEEVPVTTELPAVETEAPAVAEEVEQPAEEADVRVVDVPTGSLQADGYHYKQPSEQPVELKEAAKEYLPPLGADVVAEGPADGESAVLTKDGYQYRAIRRYRF